MHPSPDEIRDDEFEKWLFSKHDAQAALPSAVIHDPDWMPLHRSALGKGASAAMQWYIQCQLHGLEALRTVVEIEPRRRGGRPVLRGTRFTVSQVLAELSDTDGVDDVARRFRLDADTIREVLHGVSLLLDRPFDK